MGPPEHDRDQRDEAAAGGHALHELRDERERELRPGEPAEAPDRRTATYSCVAHDPDAARSDRILAHRADAQAQRVVEEQDLGQRHQQDREIDEDRVARHERPDDRDVLDERDVDLRQALRFGS